MRLSFGDFVVDFDERRLFSGRQELRLTPKAFELLRLLVESRPKALSKQEIFERLWPGTFVTENNLATLVADLRASLGDQASEPRYIRTVYAYGYAFAGDAVELSATTPNHDAPRWRLLCDGREFSLKPGDNILGRTGEGIIALDAPSVSRQHARLTIADGQAVIEDLLVTIHALLGAVTTETVERPQ